MHTYDLVVTCLSWLFFSSFPDRDFPGAPVVKTVLPMQGVWVRSLVRELRSHMPHGKKQNTKQKQYCNKFNKDFKKVRIKKKTNKKTNDVWRDKRRRSLLLL